MAGNSVTFELRAEDQGAVATAERVGAAVTAQARAVERTTTATAAQTSAASAAERQQRRLQNAIAGSTSAAGLAATAVSNLRGMLLSVPMGAVAGATAALTATLIEQAVKWLDLETAVSRAEKTLKSFGQTTAQAVAPALLPIQTRIEEINKQLGNINARTPQAAAAIEARLIAERDNLTRLRDTILGPKLNEQQIGYGANQEAMGRRIQEQAKRDWEASQAIILAKSTFEIERAKIDSQVREQSAAEAAAIQEQRGRDIQAQAKREWDEQQALILAKSTFEIEMAEITAAGVQKTEEFKIQSVQHGVAALASIADAANSLAQGKSRALFSVAKAAAIAQATVDTYAAANAALKGPPGPPWSYAIAAAAVAAGLANVARIGSTQFGGGGGGRASVPSGGPGSIGGPSIVGGIPPGARDITPPRPVNVELNFYSTVSDEASVRRFLTDNLPLLGQVIKEANGGAGPVTIEFTSA